MDGGGGEDVADETGKALPEPKTPERVRHLSGSAPALSGDMTSNQPRSRHSSGNPPGVRGLIIESRRSRDSSPNRGASPYRSPGVSPNFLMGDRTFTLPNVGGTRARISSSTSDNTIHSGGARPKSAPRETRPKNNAQSSSEIDSTHHSSSRRHSGSNLSTRRGNRQRLSTSESLPPTFAPDGRDPRDVAAQSEEIMKNFMFEKYNRDLLQNEGDLVNVPRSPTILENITTQPQTRTSAIGRRLAAIGDEIDSRYHDEFKAMTKSLNIKQGATEHAYDAFRGVAMKLFNDGLSMGRIVSLLQFGYHLAIDVLRQGIGDFMADIIGWLVRFISMEKIRNIVSNTYQSIAEWIAGQGGWQAAVDSMSNAGNALLDVAWYMTTYIAASAAIVAAVWWLRRS